MQRGRVLGIAAAAALGVGAWGLARGPAAVREAGPGDPSGRAENLAGAAGPDRPRAPADVAVVPGRIEGLVLAPDGRAAAGVEVTFVPEPRSAGTVEVTDARLRETLEALDVPVGTSVPPQATVPTGADGAFAASVPGAGPWRVTAVPADGGPTAHATTVAGRRDAPARVVLRLRAGRPLRGRLLTAGGAPLAAEVSHVPAERDGRAGPVATDPATGAFRLGVPDGRGWIEARVPGRGRARWFVRTPRDDEGTWRWPAAVVRGRLTDVHGAPQPDVDLVFDVRTPDGRSEARARTGADGAYRAEGVEAGDLVEVAMFPPSGRPRRVWGVAGAYTPTTVVADAETVVDLVLPKGGAVTGRVVGPDGGPVPDATVHLVAGAFVGDTQPRAAKVGPDGAFRFDDVPPGRWALWPRAPRFVYLPATPLGAPLVAADGGDPSLESPFVFVPEDGSPPARVLRMDAGARLAGRVVGPDGGPVPGAEVGPLDGYTAHQVTAPWRVAPLRVLDPAFVPVGPDGRFAFDDLPPRGTLRLVARAPGFVGRPSASVVHGPEAPPPTDLVLELVLGATVAGQVVDAAGVPVPGLEVTYRPDDRGLPRSRTVADDGGAFRLPGLRPGPGRVSTWRDDGTSAEAAVAALAPGATQAGVVLRLGAPEPRVAVEGVVVDADGAPVRDRVVLIDDAGAAESSAPDGRFVLQVPPGPWRVGLARTEGDREDPPAIDVVAPATGLRLVAPRTTPPARAEVTVRVLDPAGSPVASAEVVLGAVDGGRGWAHAEVRDGLAVLRFAGVPPWSVAVRGPSGPDGRRVGGVAAPVRVDGPGPHHVEVQLATGRAVEGRVVDADGAPVAHLRVVVGATVGLTGPDGGFRVVGLGDAPVQVVVDGAPPGASAPPPVLTTPGGPPVELRLGRAGSVSGRVEAAVPLDGVRLEVVVGRRTFPVAADGSFRVDDLPAGGAVRLTVRPSWGGRAGASPVVPRTVPDVPVGTTGLVVRLEAAARVRGVVVDAAGRPLPWGLLVARTGTPPLRAYATVEDGRFEVGGLPAGRWWLHVDPQSGVGWLDDVEVEAPRDDLRLELPPTKRVTGRVVGLDGRAGEVTVFVPGRDPLETLGSVEVAGTGAFELAVPDLGTYTLTATAGDRWARATGVRPGEAVELRLAPGEVLAGRVLEADGAAPGRALPVRAVADGFVGAARADTGGAFRMEGLPPGTYRLWGWPDDGDGPPVELGTAAAGATDVTLRLPAR